MQKAGSHSGPNRLNGHRSRYLLIFLSLLGALACGASWAVSSPVGSSPDDGYHQTQIWCWGATDGPTDTCTATPTETEHTYAFEVPTLVAGPTCWTGLPEQAADCQDPLHGQPVTYTVTNDDYPGGYYAFMHVFASDQVARSVIAMRLTNVLIAGLLLGGIAIVTTSAIRRTMLVIMAPLLIPLGWFMISSVNPSSWAITGLSTFGFGLHTIFSQPGRRRAIAAGALSVIGVAMAMTARNDSPAYALAIVAAMVVLHWRVALANKKLVVGFGLALLAACMWQLLSARQVADVAGTPLETERRGREVFLGLILDSTSYLQGFAGSGWGLGWLDTFVPPLTTYPVLVITGYLLITGLSRYTHAKAIACTIIFLPMFVLPLVILYRNRLSVGEFIQARYMLPLMPIFLLILLTDAKLRSLVNLTRGQEIVIWFALTVANGAAIYANTRRYVTGTDGPKWINKVDWWWESAPLGPVPMIWIGTIGFALFASPLLWSALKSERRKPGKKRSAATTLATES